ncbi:MAG: LuxR C-terminal-related transcriptional regulator [Cytophagaceae bacterium]|jgi:DNA-binding CsgD family transcriptional regulator|nr:LuxR C-terminal-related transcriptional regulator [Cytophagaceae bacterium]
MNTSYQSFLRKIKIKDSEIENVEALQKYSSFSVLPTFDAFMETMPCAPAIINYQKPGFEFMGNNIEKILGYSASEFLSPNGSSLFISCIIPEHRDFFLTIVTPTIIRLCQLHKKNFKKLKVISCVQLQKKNGERIWGLFHNQVLEVSTGGAPLILSSFLTDISLVKESNFASEYSFLEKDANERLMLSHTVFHAQRGMHTLTEKETQVLEGIYRGFTSQEIAARLNISLNTVKTHRSHIFKKTDSKNVVELIKNARQLGLL